MGFLNGWNKAQVKKVIDTLYKGRAVSNDGACQYLTEEGRKCGVGIFIPDGHEAQKSTLTPMGVISEYLDLIQHMPLYAFSLMHIQDLHDNSISFKCANLEEQRKMLYERFLIEAGEFDGE